MNKTPPNPINIADHLNKPIFSFNTNIDKTTIKIGEENVRVVAVAKLRKSKEIKKHSCAKAKKPPLKIANHIRGILGKKL